MRHASREKDARNQLSHTGTKAKNARTVRMVDEHPHSPTLVRQSDSRPTVCPTVASDSVRQSDRSVRQCPTVRQPGLRHCRANGWVEAVACSAMKRIRHGCAQARARRQRGALGCCQHTMVVAPVEATTRGEYSYTHRHINDDRTTFLRHKDNENSA